MATAEEAAGGLPASCLRVPARAWSGICSICTCPVSTSYALCWSCNAMQSQLDILWAEGKIGAGVDLLPVAPISLCSHESQMYSVLKRYKSDAAAQFQLAGLLSMFLQRHRSHVTGGIDIDVWTWVPSSEGRHAVHPLRKVLDHFSGMPLVDALTRGPGELGREKLSLDAYLVPDASLVNDKRVMLIEDLYVSGAHLHAASLALRQAGAIVVGQIVFARYLRPERQLHQPLLDWSGRESNPWTPEQCCECDDGVRPESFWS